jgi:hypothetical protein
MESNCAVATRQSSHARWSIALLAASFFTVPLPSALCPMPSFKTVSTGFRVWRAASCTYAAAASGIVLATA